MEAKRATPTSFQRGSVSRALWYMLALSRHLEGERGGDDEVVGRELVDDHLIGLDTAGATGDEAIKGGEEVGTALPLCPVQVAQGVEPREDRRAPQLSVRHPIALEAIRGVTDLAPES